MCTLFCRCRCRCPCIRFLCLRMREWQTMNGTQLDLSRNVHATLSLLNVRSWDIYQTCKLSKVLLLLFLENCKRESLLNNLHCAHCKSAPNHLWKTAEHQTKTNTLMHTHTQTHSQPAEQKIQTGMRLRNWLKQECKARICSCFLYLSFSSSFFSCSKCALGAHYAHRH